MMPPCSVHKNLQFALDKIKRHCLKVGGVNNPLDVRYHAATERLAFHRGCVKTQAFNLRVESPS